MQSTWTTILLGLAPVVIVGLGLAVTDRAEFGPHTPTLRTLRRWHPVAAAFAVASLVLETGSWAAALAAPWTAFTLAIATVGVGRLLSRRPAPSAAMAIDVGLIFLAVGGTWLLISRAGLRPLAFSDAIVELTAMHFHYAGFALPIAAGAAATRLGRGFALPGLVVAGVPLTAAGITLGGLPEALAATVMVAGGLGVAALLLRLAGDSATVPRLLLTIAGCALAAGMVLALWWAWSPVFGWSGPTLELMARTHGSLNALGFALLGLAGLVLLPHARSSEPSDVLVHLGRPRSERLARLHDAARPQPRSDPALLNATDLPAGFERFSRERTLGHRDLETVRRAMASWAAQGAAHVRLHPARPAVEVGSTLALLGPLGPVSFSATCVITQVIDEPDRVGFVYSTLAHHPEEGSEVFEVIRSCDGRLVARIEAVWRPASIATGWCRPITRLAQRRYVQRYLDGIAGASPTAHVSTRVDTP
jgi:uncharacterized protein (UPF0548 family)